jgi:hypothetical protein
MPLPEEEMLLGTPARSWTMAQTNGWRRWTGGALAVAVAWNLAASGAVFAQAPPVPQTPRIGQVQHLPVITISLDVGSTEKETRQVTYSPPPGWYVRGHTVDCARRSGHASFTVSTVPQNWTWSSEERIRESYKLLLDLAEQTPNSKQLQSKFILEREQLLEQMRKVRSTHHALVVDAAVRGEGFLRGGGGLQLSVTAEMVYVGTDEDLKKIVAQHRRKLE